MTKAVLCTGHLGVAGLHGFKRTKHDKH